MSSFKDFIAKAKSGNLELPEREIKNLEFETLRHRRDAYVDRLNVIRMRICRIALDRVLSPHEFKTVMDRLDAIEDEFHSQNLTCATLNRAIYKSNIVLELINISLS